MYTGLNISHRETYISPKDPDSKNPTKASLGVIDTHVLTYIEDLTTRFEYDENDPNDQGQMQIDLSRRNFLKVKFGLKSLENFMDPNTKSLLELKLEKTMVGGIEYEVVPDSVMKIIPPQLINEWAAAIVRLNVFGEKEKND